MYRFLTNLSAQHLLTLLFIQAISYSKAAFVAVALMRTKVLKYIS